MKARKPEDDIGFVSFENTIRRVVREEIDRRLKLNAEESQQRYDEGYLAGRDSG